jgi:hypothetical protein
MNYIRTKTIEFTKHDPRARKGDKAEIHGIGYNQFVQVQMQIMDSTSVESKSGKFKLESDANVKFITDCCHSLTLDGVTVEPSAEDIANLDAVYYRILLCEVLDFNGYGENEKN